MNIEKRNEAIALFMGRKKNPNGFTWTEGFIFYNEKGEVIGADGFSYLQYDSSWNHLMPACKKMDEAIDALWDNELINEYPIDYLLLEDELLEFNIDGVFFNLSNLCDWYSDYKNSCGQL
jgi:hypothetical protein